MKFTEPERRKCSRCQAEYEGFDWLGKDGMPITNFGIDEEGNAQTESDSNKYCDPCIKTLNEELRAQEAERKKIERTKARWVECVPEVYRQTDTDFPGFPLGTFEAGRSWLNGGGVGKEERRLFFGLVGESGLCKTRVLALMAKQLIWREQKIHWVNSSQFQWCCQNQFGEESSKAKCGLSACLSAPWLVFDDIGSLKNSEAVSDGLYALLEKRTAEQKPMLWTSNETIAEMLPGERITEKARKRNLSRLGGFSNILEL